MSHRDFWEQVVGQEIARRREEREISLEALAKSLGIKAELLAKYETGHIGLSANMLYKIAKALGCSMDYFYGPIKRESCVKF